MTVVSAELSSLLPSSSETFMALANCTIFLTVGLVSYRRCRRLSGYPIWRSILIGAFAGTFWLLWLVVSWANRDRIAREWRMYRRDRQASLDQCASQDSEDGMPTREA